MRKLTIVILLIGFGKIWAQTSKFPFNTIETRLHYGFIMPHHKSIEYNLNDHLRGFELNLGRFTDGSKKWHQHYRLPETGIGLYHGNLGNKEVYGITTALFGYFNAPIARTNNFALNYKIGVGLAYLSKTFDLYDNNLNTAIGSHMNVYFRFSFNTRYKLNEYWSFLSGFSYAHSSNGKMKSPNKGLNQILVNAGFAYDLWKPEREMSVQIPYAYFSENKFSLAFSSGVKMKNRYSTKKYPIYSLSFDYMKKVSVKRKLVLGTDLFYDGTIPAQYEDLGVYSTNPGDVLLAGVHVGQELYVNKLFIIMQLGAYVYRPWKENQPVYQRYGIKYLINDHVFAMVALKSHYGKADFIEWGIGYQL